VGDLCAGGKDPFDTQRDRHDDPSEAPLGLLYSMDTRSQEAAGSRYADGIKATRI
jgi:hypothetical protein